ncbi:hypothetical protein ACFL06_00540 [Patescibacteria group bacterium]
MYPDPRTGIVLSLLGDQTKVAALFALEGNENKGGLRKRVSRVCSRFARWNLTRGLSNALTEMEAKGLIQIGDSTIQLLPFGKAVLEAIKSFEETLLANHEIKEHGPIEEDTRPGAMVRTCETCGAASFWIEGTADTWGPWVKYTRLFPDCPGHKIPREEVEED